MTAAIPDFVAFEMLHMARTMLAIRRLPVRRHMPVVAMVGIEVVIYVAVEVPGPMKPRPCANEDAAVEPFRAVVAVGSAIVRRVIVVAVRTHWFWAVLHAEADLRWTAASEEQQQGCGNKQIFES